MTQKDEEMVQQLENRDQKYQAFKQEASSAVEK